MIVIHYCKRHWVDCASNGSEVWLGCMLGDEDDARAGCCMTELLSAQGLEMNAVGFDARPTLTDFRGIVRVSESR